jgi:hypothetical protein
LLAGKYGRIATNCTFGDPLYWILMVLIWPFVLRRLKIEELIKINLMINQNINVALIGNQIPANFRFNQLTD